MNRITLALFAGAAMVFPHVVQAQTATPQTGQTAQPPGTTNPGQPGMATPTRPGERTDRVQLDGTPASGANSFTEGQARSRIEDAGYAQVTGLRLDDAGVWRGQGMREGASEDVALDFRGVVYGAGAARAAAAAATAEPRRPDGTAPAQPR